MAEHPKDCTCLFCIRTNKAGPYPILHRFFPELWKLSQDKMLSKEETQKQ